MKRLFVSVLIIGLLVLTVPWFFQGVEDREWAGLPAWVVYAIGMTLVFPVVVSVLLRRCWAVFEGQDEPTNE